MLPSQGVEGYSIPLDTFLGNYVIPPFHNYAYSRDSGAGPGGSSANYTWSRGLGFETSPIKSRRARKKATPSRDSVEVVSSSTGSDIEALRGLKALARANI
jgi:hypothetical protein